MSVEIHVPELGESVTDATVGQWMKQEGDSVSAGDPLVELETDKINFEVEAEEDGVLESITKNEGDTVEVGEVIGTIGEASGEGDGQPAQEEDQEEEQEEQEESGESEEEEQAEAEQPEPEAEEETGADAETDETEEANGHREDGEVRASPSVRKLAEEYEIALAEVSASGSGGRVTRDDVERAIREQYRQSPAEEESGGQENGQADGQQSTQEPAPQPQASEDGRADLEERVRMSRRRQTIAKRLVEAQQTAAMLTTFNEADMGAIMELRSRRKEEFQERNEVKLGFMSFFTKASMSGRSRRFPKINAELQEDELVYKHYYDIGVAVNTDEGLVVPVLRGADSQELRRDRGWHSRPGDKSPRRQVGPGRLAGRDVHHYQRRHLRLAQLHPDPQHPAGCDTRPAQDPGAPDGGGR